MKGIICCGLNLAAAAWLAALSAGAQSPAAPPSGANPSAPIPMDQLGAVAGKQYQGDGLSVTATPDGARLRCAFQRLEGEVTRNGLWLRSTAGDAQSERFRVMAVEVGRTEDYGVRRQSAAPTPLFDRDWMEAVLPEFQSGVALCFPPQSKTLPVGGAVSVNGQTVRFSRPGLTEEYSVSVDGVLQDFIVEQRPAGEGELRVELDVTGAKVESLVNGARLVLDGSGRKLAYNRLRVVDATGRELPARMEVAAGVSPGVEGGSLPPGSGARTMGVSGFNCDESAISGLSAGLEAPALRQAGTPAATRLAVVVLDAAAIYPVRIDPTFSDADWISMGGIPGANGAIYAAAIDGAGNLCVGGNFTLIGDVLANRVAKWNGSTWSAFGSGMNVTVYALAVSGGDLYAGGGFTTAGGNGVNYIAKWSGSSWSALGSGMNSWVYALVVLGSDLYAGGNFSTADGNQVNYVARWNGASWSSLGLGLDYSVHALAVSSSDLFVGGYFYTATNSNGSAVTVNRVARWNGGSWSALGAGMNAQVLALAVSGTTLYAGGGFTRAGENAVNYVARWNGTSWVALGSGMRYVVSALAVSGSVLYAGGPFAPIPNGSSTTNLAKWDGSSWTSLSSGVDNSVSVLATSGSDLFIGGDFMRATNAGGIAIPVNRIAKWNSNGWSTVGWSGSGSGINWPVYALATLGNDLYAGGSFWSAGGTIANFISKWNGISWSSPSSGMNSSVLALEPVGNDLYAGGVFTTAGETPASRIAKWDGSNWSALGSGVNNTVRAIAVSVADLYVGGNFTTAGGNAVNYVSKWDGGNWSALGSGLNSNVHAVVASSNDVFLGGNFNRATNTGGVSISVNRIAKWNGNAWSSLGLGMNSSVYALAVSGSNLYVGGAFVRATNNGGTSITANHVAKWNGSTWAPLGSGMFADVYALAVSGNDVYAGGSFVTAGGTMASYIAKWDGSAWSALSSGLSGTVNALRVSGSVLYVGGNFTTAGNKISANIAMANLSAARGRFSNLIYTPATGFNCTFSEGAIGQPYRIQSSSSLAVGPWTDLTNFIYASPIVITDASAVSATNTFYRAVTP